MLVAGGESLDPGKGDFADLLGVDWPLGAVEEEVEVPDVAGVGEVEEGVANVGVPLEIDGEVEEIVAVNELSIDHFHHGVFGVAVGDVADHDRGPAGGDEVDVDVEVGRVMDWVRLTAGGPAELPEVDLESGVAKAVRRMGTGGIHEIKLFLHVSRVLLSGVERLGNTGHVESVLEMKGVERVGAVEGEAGVLAVDVGVEGLVVLAGLGILGGVHGGFLGSPAAQP